MNEEFPEVIMWRQEINVLKKRVKSVANDQRVIAFYGSSSIRLWEEMSHDLSPHSVINLGFGGSSYRWCDHFFNEVFEYLDPKEIILYAGDNDLGNEIPEEEIVASVARILSKIELNYGNIHVSIISVKPSPDRLYLKNNIENLNKRLESLIQSHPRGSFIDVHSQMLNNGMVRPELFLEDELHMNRKGYEIWKEVVKMHLDQNLLRNGGD